MNISVSEVEAVTIVMFDGRLDTNTAPDALTRLDGLIGGGTTNILVDFSGLDFISSAGLGVVLATGGAIVPSSSFMPRTLPIHPSRRRCGKGTITGSATITGSIRCWRCAVPRPTA